MFFSVTLGGLQAATNWTLVWADEFTQPDGSSPDPSKWGYNIGAGGWGNGELEYYTSRTNNARIQGGNLLIEARQESYSGSDYTSARLLTKGKWAWTYGRIEARIKIPRTQGIWPAFWMLGNNIDSVGWPTCGEIDIMENVGYSPGTIYGTIHGPGYSGGGGIGGNYSLPGGAAYADGFHVYAVEWETNQIRWYMDNVWYFTATPASLPGGATWVFDHPHFLLLNVAVGGYWPGYPDGSTVMPQQMLVDYVRVYGPSNAITSTNIYSSCGNVLTNAGLEASGLSGWSTYGNIIPNVLAESSNNVPVHSGTYVCKMFGQFTGSENYSGIFQDYSASPGATFAARGWALTPTGDSIAGGNAAWIEVSFRDAAANILSLYRTALIGSSTPTGTWINLAVTNQLNTSTYTVTNTVTDLVAPSGTSFVRYQIVFRQPLYDAGAVLFDDLTLEIPGPTNIDVSAMPDLAQGKLSMTIPTVSGFPYSLQFKDELSATNWQVLSNFAGAGVPKTVSDSLNMQERFYRVVCSCQ